MAGPEPISVRQSVRVGLPPPAAFRLFTDGIGEWWPLREGYSHGGDRADGIFLEAHEGGRFYERFVDGDTIEVGRVVACQPPQRIVFEWRSPQWPAATEVEVRFRATGAGTVVDLEHRGFERIGPHGADIARQWRNCWPYVVGRFAASAGA